MSQPHHQWACAAQLRQDGHPSCPPDSACTGLALALCVWGMSMCWRILLEWAKFRAQVAVLPAFLDTMQSGVVERELRGGHKHREVGCPCCFASDNDGPRAAAAAEHEKGTTRGTEQLFERFRAYILCCTRCLRITAVEALHHDTEFLPQL